jgi:hypothetical protein
LAFKVVEEVNELIVVAIQKREAELVFQIRRKLAIKIIISLERLNNSDHVAMFDVLHRVLIYVFINITCFIRAAPLKDLSFNLLLSLINVL